MSTLLLVDGNYYVYRSFHAIRGLTNSRGEPTNAIYGFIRALRKMVADIQPDFAAVAWDQGLPRRRTEMHPAYKAQRAEMPEDMRPQIAFLRETAPLMGFTSLSLPDTEADDLIATYAHAARNKDMDVVIATNDKDLMQLVDTHVHIYSTHKKDLELTKQGFALLSREDVKNKWGLPPEQIGELLALMGDSVDNIPGVEGFGQKTALRWLEKFGSLQNLIDQSDQIDNPRIREVLMRSKEQIFLNREMVRLDTDLPMPASLNDLALKINYPLFIQALKTCEFKSLLTEVELESRGQMELF